MKLIIIFIALTITACVTAAAVAHRRPAQHSPGTQYITIQIWSQEVTTDQVTPTYRNVSKLAEFRADGTWEEVADMDGAQKRVIAERLKTMLNNWVDGQGLKQP
jgi:hypothetical protein